MRHAAAYVSQQRVSWLVLSKRAPLLYRATLTSLGAGGHATWQARARGRFLGLVPGLREGLHDRACNEQRDDGDELSDQDGAIQVERRPPLDLAVLDHPGAGGHRAHP